MEKTVTCKCGREALWLCRGCGRPLCPKCVCNYYSESGQLHHPVVEQAMVWCKECTVEGRKFPWVSKKESAMINSEIKSD